MPFFLFLLIFAEGWTRCLYHVEFKLVCNGWHLSFRLYQWPQSTVRKKMAAVHFTTIPCEPNTANKR